MTNYASAGNNNNDRDARRAGIVAGAIRANVKSEKAHDRYEECMRESEYDSHCERQLHRDERQGRNAARRTAIIVAADRK